MARTKIWVSGLVPADGANIYDGGIRLAVSDTEAEAYRDLADWLVEVSGADHPDDFLVGATVDEIAHALNETPEIRHWNIESREV